MPMTSDPEGDFTAPSKEMTQLKQRICEFKLKWFFRPGERYGRSFLFDKDLKAEILWLRENPLPHKQDGTPGRLWETTGIRKEAWQSALDTLLLYLEDKK